METWASLSKFRHDVRFLCVCVESLGVAQWFARMFHFKHSINCYIPSRGYMPVGYGQLGCSGFIVSNDQGNFVSRKTKAYLDYGEEAFDHVEEILSSLLARNKVSSSPSSSPAAVSTSTTESNAGANGTPTTTDELTTEVAQTGIDCMDEEHASCSTAFETLIGRRSKESLVQVLKELEHHFDHEEALMKSYGFGGSPNDSFSALSSHVQDHKKILSIASNELERLSSSSSSASCQLKKNAVVE